jgi:hypothetical protein
MQKHLDKLKSKPLSWSSISSFEYNPKTWANNYLKGEKSPPTEELIFGKEVDERIQVDPNFLPGLPRYEKMQLKMEAKISGIHLLGIPDGVNFEKNKQLADYKTGVKKWTQKRADETGQLLFYLLLLYCNYNIRPEEFDCFIHWLPTKKVEDMDFNKTISFIESGDVQTFKVKHTLKEVMEFGGYLKRTYKKMCKLALKYNE